MISKINDHLSSVSHSNTELIQVSHNVVIYIIGSVLSSLENLMVKKKISDINEFKVEAITVFYRLLLFSIRYLKNKCIFKCP